MHDCKYGTLKGVSIELGRMAENEDIIYRGTERVDGVKRRCGKESELKDKEASQHFSCLVQ